MGTALGACRRYRSEAKPSAPGLSPFFFAAFVYQTEKIWDSSVA